MRVILASGSPRRADLLRKIRLDFIIVPANVKEINELNDLSIEQIAQKNALMKAMALANKFTNSLIIGADTIVFFENKLIGKPKNAEDAKKMLKGFSGKWHSVYTGIALVETNTKKQIVDFEKTKVKFKKLSEKEITDYIATREPRDMAGAYAIQGKGKFLIEKIEGSYTNIVGLPMEKLCARLKEAGIKNSRAKNEEYYKKKFFRQ